MDGAESATVVTTFTGFDRRTIPYSSAGRLPPVLVRSDGLVERRGEDIDRVIVRV
ncbi:hypothetical protein GCM10010260_74750 [Streptomyces filipinensis]|uniref:Uncharacterized protein n=1 Tax=Streptomyces filipinensis TaxID=66887 RepID=A0A918IK59_9ACTN|nr:hypothetical protein GCM10010260_74750 [Streptomyces filipinensis]